MNVDVIVGFPAACDAAVGESECHRSCKSISCCSTACLQQQRHATCCLWKSVRTPVGNIT